jgi:hypothetical protein
MKRATLLMLLILFAGGLFCACAGDKRTPTQRERDEVRQIRDREIDGLEDEVP